MALQVVCPTCGNREMLGEARPGADAQDKDGELTVDLFCSEGHYLTRVTGPVADVRQTYVQP